ncbi:MAG: type I-D CRISPR-associated endonuclease Cas1d [Chloroflexota bacterium]
MPTLYLSEQHTVVRKDGDCLLVQPPRDGNGLTGKKVKVPLIKVDHVIVEGNVTITTPALHALLDNQVEVSFLSYYGNFKGMLSPGFSKNSLLRIAQHEAHNDPGRRLTLARQFVLGKIANMRTLLMRYRRKEGQEHLARSINIIEDAMEAVPQVTTMESLIGQEGAASAAYFSGFATLLNQKMGFRGRFRRPPTDPVNALLSYGYTILTSKLSSIIHAVGMDPYVGYLHSSQYGRPALALDLLEEFRPVIVDSVVLTAINTRVLQRQDFIEEMGSFRLADEAHKEFLRKFEERLNTQIVHAVFRYRTTYRRCLELQARLLSKVLMGEIPNYIPFAVR